MKNNFLVFLILICFASNAHGDKKLFKSDAPLRLTLTAPFATIYAERDKTKTYPHAKLVFIDDEKKNVSLDIGVKVRGNFRLKKKELLQPTFKVNDWERCKR